MHIVPASYIKEQTDSTSRLQQMCIALSTGAETEFVNSSCNSLPKELWLTTSPSELNQMELSSLFLRDATPKVLSFRLYTVYKKMVGKPLAAILVHNGLGKSST